MNRFLNVGAGISLFVTLLASSTTALLTDMEEKATVFTIDGTTVQISLSVGKIGDEVAVDPGATLALVPTITNEGTGEVNVFMELDVPLVNNKPIITFDTGEGWTLIADPTTTEDGYKKFGYSYGGEDSLTGLLSTEVTTSLITTATFNNVKADSNARVTMTIKGYAVGADGVGDEEPVDQVWETTVNLAG